MHEMSVAQNILEIVNEHLAANGNQKVKSVTLRVGEMAGIVGESLEFCFTALTVDTPLKDAALNIEPVPITAQCRECQQISRLQYGTFICPSCHSFDIDLLSGTELHVVEIELND